MQTLPHGQTARNNRQGHPSPCSPLGTNTNLRHPSDPALLRLRRWGLQEAARVALRGFARTDKHDREQFKFRVNHCCRRPKDLDVKIAKKNGRHHYQGVMMCGSVWTCPICGAKISERRRQELHQVVDAHRAAGGDVLMLTQTVPHYDHDKLSTVKDSFMAARRLQRKRKPWQRFAARYLDGIVTALEVTHGDNGWHVHTHEILFVNATFLSEWEAYRRNNLHTYMLHKQAIRAAQIAGVNPPKDPFLVSFILPLWQTWADACTSAGLKEPSLQHGVDLSDNKEVAGYVGKWGVDYELTKAHLKKSRAGGRTPWAILDDWFEYGDEDDKRLFQVFANEFHGAQQLRWSRGLKSRYHIEEVTDEQILDQAQDGTIIHRISLEDWRIICKLEMRGTVLEWANTGGQPAVAEFIDKLKGDPCRFAKYVTKRVQRRTVLSTA